MKHDPGPRSAFERFWFAAGDRLRPPSTVTPASHATRRAWAVEAFERWRTGRLDFPDEAPQEELFGTPGSEPR